MAKFKDVKQRAESLGLVLTKRKEHDLTFYRLQHIDKDETFGAATTLYGIKKLLDNVVEINKLNDGLTAVYQRRFDELKERASEYYYLILTKNKSKYLLLEVDDGGMYSSGRNLSEIEALLDTYDVIKYTD